MKLIMLLAVCLLSACATKVMQSEKPADAPYVLGAGDTIKITVFGEEKLSGDHKVDGREVIRFPLLGEVSVKDQTVAQFQDALVSKLSKGYLNSPKLTVDLVTSKPIYILGEVENPGEYPFDEAMTVYQAVAKAGGFTYRAGRGRVYVLHYGEQKENAYSLEAATRLAPGDTVRIAERFF